jgi:hypothetical protein
VNVTLDVLTPLLQFGLERFHDPFRRVVLLPVSA